MVRKLKAFNVNIVLDYLKNTVHNLLTITTNIQGSGCSGKEVLCHDDYDLHPKSIWKILELTRNT